MSSLLFFLLVQMALPPLLGYLVHLHLKEATRSILLDLCGTEARADYWVRTLGLLMVLTPLCAVLLFGGSLSAAPLQDALRRVASLSVLGVLAAVAVTTRAVWRRVPQGELP